MSKKIPLNYLHWKFDFWPLSLLCIILKEPRRFVSFCLSYCLFVTLYIKNDKSFPREVFRRSSIHILSMFLMNKILFLVTGSGQNNAIFPPTCPKLMKIAQKLALNKVWMIYLEFRI